MQDLTDSKELLGLNMALTVSPALIVEKETGVATPPADNGRFLLYADAAIQYDSLSRALTTLVAGKRFDLSEGLFAKHVIINNIEISGYPANGLLVKVLFTGSFKGTATFTGVPVYRQESSSIELLHLRYDLQTGNLLLQGAKLLFASRIERELKKRGRFPVGPLLTQVQQALSESLNKEWAKGIRGSGAVKDLRLLRVEALPENLLIKVSCDGSLQITLSAIAFDFNR